MQKLSRKLILLFVLAVSVFALSLPTEQVEAAGDSCGVIGALCRLASAVDYDICVGTGGNASDCAWAEAHQTINCLQQAGCPLNH